MRELLGAFAPWAEKYGVAVGVPSHHGRFVSSMLGVLELLDGFPERHFQLVWDVAHDALPGDDPAVTFAAGSVGIAPLLHPECAAALTAQAE
jgi:sugar phosphate isomerase/epimerase